MAHTMVLYLLLDDKETRHPISQGPQRLGGITNSCKTKDKCDTLAQEKGKHDDRLTVDEYIADSLTQRSGSW